MTIKQKLNVYPVKDLTYYQCYVWKDKTKYGETDDRLYKTKANAEKRMTELIKSGRYEMVVMRKEEIWFRNETNEFSASGVEAKWEVVA